MKERIQAFLQAENKSYAQFAEEIGVQPSGISHILSGRNNPSLDFVIKMLHKFPSLSTEWLLFGRGSMYKYVSEPTLFDMEPVLKPSKEVYDVNEHEVSNSNMISPDSQITSSEEETEAGTGKDDTGKKLIRVLLFYSDKTFSEYRPC